MAKKKKRRSPVGLILAAIILVVVIVCAIYGTKVYKGYMKDYKGTETVAGEDVVVEIPQGASAKKIAAILKEKGLIEYESAFVKRVKESQYRGQLRYGTYTLNTGMNTLEMIEIMSKSEDVVDTVKVTIPEGYSVEMIATLLEEQKICSRDEFLNALNVSDYSDFDFVSGIPNDTNIKYKLQGFLFPATYDIPVGATPHDIISMMLTKYNTVFGEQYSARAAELGYTEYQIITMASIVEREAQLESERPIIAGVLYNRLNINMKLQMCPTVLYPLTDGMYDKNEVTYADLEIVSPYNTYQNEGLPIGPICNPGDACINAVLYPQESTYLYYHTNDAGDGGHIFSETYEEHLETK